jgi:hypothetical protein
MCCGSPIHETHSTEIENLVRTLGPKDAAGDQIAAARQVALLQMNLTRIRSLRATLIGSLNPERYDIGDLRRLLVLDRYERIARAKRRKAADKL